MTSRHNDHQPHRDPREVTIVTCCNQSSVLSLSQCVSQMPILKSAYYPGLMRNRTLIETVLESYNLIIETFEPQSVIIGLILNGLQ